MKLRFLRLTATLLLTFTFGQSAAVFATADSQPLFFTPSGDTVPEVINAINGAKSTIRMEMYHLSLPSVIDALIAAKQRGVDIQVILDNQQVNNEKSNGAFHMLSAAGIKVVKSSAGPSGFSLTHTKTFVIDSETAYIMTLNLTRLVSSGRDVGYITNDKDTIQFFETLFVMDLKNSAESSANSPLSIPDNIVLSPVNSRARLSALISSAKKSALIEVENLSDDTLMNDMIQAKARGVDVQVLLPRCSLSNSDFDMPAARKLATAQVTVKLMPAPSTADTPYIHQKSIVIDGEKAYLGSVNFSFNSLDRARELGIIISEVPKVKQIAQMFNSDFALSLNMQQAETAVCPKSPFNEDFPITE